jgi:hypothetical protein
VTRGELQARFGALRVSCVYVHGRKVAGGFALKEFLRTASTATLNLALEDLRRRGIDIHSAKVSPCRFPFEVPAPREELPSAGRDVPVAAPDRKATRQAPPIDDAEEARARARLLAYAFPPLEWFRAVSPTAEQMAIVHRATAHALKLGLRLPTYPGLTVVFVAPPAGLTTNYGEAGQLNDGRIRFWLRADHPLPDLARLVFHELAHCHDCASGRLESMSEQEREERAHWFTVRAMEDWAAVSAASAAV